MDRGPGGFPVVTGYELMSVLGRGGFSAVYRADQLSVGRPVALKVLDSRAMDPELEKRFKAECRTVGALSWHPHILAIFDAGLAEDGRPYMAMELFERGSLADRLKAHGRMPPDDVVRVGLEISDALSTAHESGVIHRDVKPANILVGRRGEFVLGDFGIAAFSDVTRSATGNFSGTLAFTAPEVLLGERATVASDVFSLGVTLHTLLSGASTFASGGSTSPGAVIQRVLNEQPPPLPPDVPRWLVDVVGQATQKTPGERFGSVAALTEALLRGTPEPGPPAPPTLADPADTAMRQPLPTPSAQPNPVPAATAPAPDAAPPTADSTEISNEPPPAAARPEVAAPQATTAGAKRTRSRTIRVIVASAIIAVGIVAAVRVVRTPEDTIVLDRGFGAVAELESGSDGALVALTDHRGDGSARVITVGTRTGDVESLRTLETQVSDLSMAAAGGSIWLRTGSGPDGQPAALLELDDRSGETVATVDVRGGFTKTAAIAGGSAWTTSRESGKPTIVRIGAQGEPETVTDLDARNVVDLDGTDDTLWVLAGAALGSDTSGAVFRIDATSGALTDSIALDVPVSFGSIAADGDNVWIALDAGSDGRLLRVDPSDGSVDVDLPNSELFDGLLVMGDALYTTTTNADGEGRFERRDATTGEVESVHELGPIVGPIAESAGSVWAYTADLDDSVGVSEPTNFRLERFRT